MPTTKPAKIRATKLLDTVPAQWPVGRHCKIAFVGEAPSDYERLEGFPLCGPPGRVFDQILRVAGLAVADDTYPCTNRRVRRLVQARAPFLITNVFDEQLPTVGNKSNNLGGWCAQAAEAKTWPNYSHLKIGGHGYLRPEHLHHLERLAQELTEAAPNVVVPLGSAALWSLSEVSDITLARGAASTATCLVPGMKILPTYHPAHVMQDWKLFQVVVADLLKALHESEFPEVRLVKRRIHVRPTEADLARWEQKLMGAARLSVDIETAKHQITCIGFAPSETEAYVVPFVDYAEPSRSYWFSAELEARAWAMVRRLCESGIPKTFQNGLYDAYYLIRQAGIWPMNYDEDTRLQHHALYPELPKSLAFMGATYAQQGPWKLMRSGRGEKKDE